MPTSYQQPAPFGCGGVGICGESEGSKGTGECAESRRHHVSINSAGQILEIQVTVQAFDKLARGPGPAARGAAQQHRRPSECVWAPWPGELYAAAAPTRGSPGPTPGCRLQPGFPARRHARRLRAPKPTPRRNRRGIDRCRASCLPRRRAIRMWPSSVWLHPNTGRPATISPTPTPVPTVMYAKSSSPRAAPQRPSASAAPLTSVLIFDRYAAMGPQPADDIGAFPTGLDCGGDVAEPVATRGEGPADRMRRVPGPRWAREWPASRREPS